MASGIIPSCRLLTSMRLFIDDPLAHGFASTDVQKSLEEKLRVEAGEDREGGGKGEAT